MTTLRIASLLLACASALSAQTRVDHAVWQTPLQNQGSRTTCIAFSATAALEARYKRAGYGDLNLSEEFVNYVGKMMWLHPYWADINTADETESQLAATGGGGGVGHAHNMVHWMKVPAETAMPYRLSGYAYSPAWNDPWWTSQRNVNTFNLDPANFPHSARNAAEYHFATGLVDLGLTGARNTTTIENALRAGYEVIWDSQIDDGTGTPIWHPAGPVRDAHSMLIIGYDRTSANPANHYFIVKNSWGPTSNTNGMTHVGYDYVAARGINACYLTGAATPGPWNALRFLGRRNMSFDGFRGTLDISHIPGASQETWSSAYGVTTTDRRLGLFYDTAGNVYRVNGQIVGDMVQFWLKPTNANMPWDEQRETPTVGRMFSYRLLDSADQKDDLAGYHWDNAGSTPTPAYGGYAKRATTVNGTNGFELPVFDNSQAWTPAQWLGRWRLRYDSRDVTLQIDQRNDTLLPLADRATWAGFQAYTFDATALVWHAVTARVDLAGSREIRFDTNPAQDNASIVAYMQSWQRGVAAGRTTLGAFGIFEGALMTRLGDHDFGSYTSRWSGCGASVVRPALSGSGLPEIGRTITYRVSNALPYGGAVLSLGVSDTAWNGAPLPLDLGVIGATGCWMYAEPLATFFTGADSSGIASWSFMFNQAGMRGVPIYSQGYVLDAAANAAGFRSSNLLTTRLGGSY